MNSPKAKLNKSPDRRPNIVLRLLGPLRPAVDGFSTTPFMIGIQIVSAQIGRVTGKGIIANVKDFAPRWLVISLVSILVIANTFNIAADLAAMGEALSLVIGGLNREHALILAATSVLLQVFALPALCARSEDSHLGVIPICGHCLHCSYSVGRSVRARSVAGCRD